MPNYAVHLISTISAVVVVEASDEEAAIEKGVDNAPQTDFAFANFDADDWQVNEDAAVELTDRQQSDWVYDD